MTREVSYVEVLECEFQVSDAVEAYDLATAIGNGGQVDYPALRKIVTVDRQPIDEQTLRVDVIEDDDDA